MTSPDGIDMEYALRFGFRASNNEAEYEAVIAGLNSPISSARGEQRLPTGGKTDRRLYEARGEKMILYLKKVRELLKKFVRVQVIHVPRSENSLADYLVKLAIALQEDLRRLHLSSTYQSP